MDQACSQDEDVKVCVHTVTSHAMSAPNSPGGDFQSPPPEELVAVHDELLGLAHALYNLGTTVLEDLSKEGPSVEKPVGKRV